jgi:hypothetical protein
MRSVLLEVGSGYVTHVTHLAGTAGAFDAKASSFDRWGSGIRLYDSGMPHQQ